MAEAAFDVIPYSDIKGGWKKLGSGSFGNVYKGMPRSYLGIDVAIKEVLPSTDYDVGKYFEREYRLMKEARHPNVVLYLGLSRAPDGRIFIVSEFVEGGNLRTYIYDKSKPFPWSLRMSFATDICRALAYLHARKCIHRDLKGENLLITSNLRIKVTDFGFARIAARNDMESKRLTFCGTDAYMSPEIQLGTPFDLPTDVYSLGIILAEISARRLADDTHFARSAPSFSIDPDEVRRCASPGCPGAFVDLVIDCLQDNPTERPPVINILERLRIIEAEVVARPENKDMHIGSVKFLSKGRKAGQAPRIPSFGSFTRSLHVDDNRDAEEDELAEAVFGLAEVDVNDPGTFLSKIGQVLTVDIVVETETELEEMYTNLPSDYSTTVMKTPVDLSSHLSTITMRPNDSQQPLLDPTSSIQSLDAYYTPTGSQMSTAVVPGDTSSIHPLSSSLQSQMSSPLLLHRFTLIKPGTKRSMGLPVMSLASGPKAEIPKSSGIVPWSPFQIFFSSGLLITRCDVCSQRLGWKPSLECDDCGLRTHLKCSDLAPCNCGFRDGKKAD